MTTRVLVDYDDDAPTTTSFMSSRRWSSRSWGHLLLPQHLLAWSTIALSISSLTFLVGCGLGCDFAEPSSSSSSSTANPDDDLPPFGIFCDAYDYDRPAAVMPFLSRLSLCASALLSFVLSASTTTSTMADPSSSALLSPSAIAYLWGTALPLLSTVAIVFHPPVLLILLDAGLCPPDEDEDGGGGGCRLRGGSATLFLSMASLVALAAVVRVNDPPDWREERELWKLMRALEDGGGRRDIRPDGGGEGEGDGDGEDEEGGGRVVVDDDNDSERGVPSSPPPDRVGHIDAPGTTTSTTWKSPSAVVRDVESDGVLPVVSVDSKRKTAGPNNAVDTTSRRAIDATGTKTAASRRTPATVIDDYDDIGSGVEGDGKPPVVFADAIRTAGPNIAVAVESNSKMVDAGRRGGGGGGPMKSHGRTGMVVVVDQRHATTQAMTMTLVHVIDDGVGVGVGVGVDDASREMTRERVSSYLRKERTRREEEEEEEARRLRNLVLQRERLRRPSTNYATKSTTTTMTSSSGPPVHSVTVVPTISIRGDGSEEDDSSLRISCTSSNEFVESPSSSSVRRMMAESSSICRGKRSGIVENGNNENGNVVHIIAQHDDDYDEGVVDRWGGARNNDNGIGNVTRRKGDDNSNPVRIVSPEKEDERNKDPDLDVYPSESSLSELSLDCYQSTDDDDDNRNNERYQLKGKNRKNNHKRQQQHPKPSLHPRQDDDNDRTKTAGPYYSSDSSDGLGSSDDSDTELYAVIAGVRKLNRRTSGKNAPQNKRRRRRRRKADHEIGSSASLFSSHGSLLDEVIHEEGELNSSNEAPTSGDGGDGWKELLGRGGVSEPIFVPGMIASSSTPSPAMNKTKEIRSMSNGSNREDELRPSPDESDDHSISRNISVGGVSDSEESLSARAARARRQRISSETRLGGPLPSFSRPVLLPDDFADDDDNDDLPDRRHKNENGRGNVPDRGINNRLPPSAIVMPYGSEKDCSARTVDHNGDRIANHNNLAWQARQVRMARLRMIRGLETPSTEAATATIATVEIGNKLSGAKVEPEGLIVRANDRSFSECYSDESSI